MYFVVKKYTLVDFFAVHRIFYNKNPLSTIQVILIKEKIISFNAIFDNMLPETYQKYT